MIVKWYNSINIKIFVGMALFMTAFAISWVASFSTLGQFNETASSYTTKIIPELEKVSELKNGVNLVNSLIVKLHFVQGELDQRVVTQKLKPAMQELLLLVSELNESERKTTILNLLESLRDILTKITSMHQQRLGHLSYIEQQTKSLEALMLLPTFSQQSFNVQLASDTLALMKARNDYVKHQLISRMQSTIKQANSSNTNTPMVEVSENMLNSINQVKAIDTSLSISLTKLDIAMEMLSLDVYKYFFDIQEQAVAQADSLSKDSERAKETTLWLMLATVTASIFLMRFYHITIIKRLKKIASYITKPAGKLTDEVPGKTEITFIAMAIDEYIARNEDQKERISSFSRQLMDIIRLSNNAICIFDKNQVPIFSNEAFGDCLVGTNLKDFLDQLNQANNKDFSFVLNERYFKPFIKDIVWDEQECSLVILTDITEEFSKELALTASLKKASDESFTDPLTGLFNRRKLQDIFNGEFAPNSYSMIVSDIDWFKNYNDFYGHAAGDVCIQQVADVLKQSIRGEADYAFRYGGEEFVILLANKSKLQAKAIAERIYQKLEALCIPHEQSPLGCLTLSTGIAHIDEVEPQNWQTVFDKADKRLYQAKAEGRNRFIANID